jgi:hypothetical protein
MAILWQRPKTDWPKFARPIQANLNKASMALSQGPLLGIVNSLGHQATSLDFYQDLETGCPNKVPVVFICSLWSKTICINTYQCPNASCENKLCKKVYFEYFCCLEVRRCGVVTSMTGRHDWSSTSRAWLGDMTEAPHLERKTNLLDSFFARVLCLTANLIFPWNGRYNISEHMMSMPHRNFGLTRSINSK